MTRVERTAALFLCPFNDIISFVLVPGALVDIADLA
jgi:hypothetical protein